MSRLRMQFVGLTMFLALITVMTAIPSIAAPGDTVRVSVSTSGGQGSSWSETYGGSSISADGRFVVFESNASNLVPVDSNGGPSIFVRDRLTGTTELVSLSTSGSQGFSYSFDPSISADGRYVAFSSFAQLAPDDTNGFIDIYVRDRIAATTERVSVNTAEIGSNSDNVNAMISSTGRFVTWQSRASNLASGDTFGRVDVFIRDRTAGTTDRVSLSDGDSEVDADSLAPAAVSADGRYVTFVSGSPLLVPADTNGRQDVFVRDRTDGTTERLSVATGGTQANEGSSNAVMSADGQYVVFGSCASNLVIVDTNGKCDVFVRDTAGDTTGLVSTDSAEDLANGHSEQPAISTDGRFVVFSSSATDLVTGDVNGFQDVFVRDLLAGTTSIRSLNSSGQQANSSSFTPSTSSDASFVVFSSNATNLTTSDTNFERDVFVNEASPPPSDTTAPIVTGTPDRPANDAGWYDAPVTIDWLSEDPEPSSGTPTDPPDTIAGTEGSNVLYTSDPSCDPANNCATGPLMLSIDLSDPEVTCLPQPTFELGQVGAEVSATVEDSVSGPASPLVSDVVDTSLIGVHAVDLSGEDLAGHMASASCSYRVRESGLPMVTGTPDRPANGNGWFDAPVTIDWLSEDPPPSSGTPSDPADTLAETEGANVQYVSESSCDPDGNCSTGSLVLSIDLSDPDVTCTAPPALILNQPGVQVTATVTDEVSGPAAPLVSAMADTSTVGTHTVNLTGQDLAGRSTTTPCPYSVGYNFGGFFAPVDNLPIVNSATAGQAIPLKWQLTDYAGNPITDPASFVSVTSGSNACSTTDPMDAIETYTGASGLTYLGDGNWQFNWKTPKEYTGKCRVMHLSLGDGSDRTASFQFK